MQRMRNSSLIAVLAMLTIAIAMTAGCGKKERDPFSEAWQRMAKQSPGHTPTPVEPDLGVDQIMESEVLTKEEPAEPPMPTTPVVMNSPSIDVHTALRALARAANQSIIISQNVEGVTTAVFNGEPWADAFKSICSSAGLIYSRQGNIIKVMAVDDLEKELKLIELKQQRLAKENQIRRGSDLLTAVLKIKYADAATLQEDLGSFLSKDDKDQPLGAVKLDTHTNSLVIQALRGDLKKIITLVQRIDRPSAQISLKAYIVETTSDTARALGVQWGGNYARGPVGGNSDNNLFFFPGGSGVIDPDTGINTITSALGTGATGSGLGMSFPAPEVPTDGAGAVLGLAFGRVGGNILEAQLSALESDNKLKILSSPSLATLDNQTAYTENGAKVPYVTIEDGEREVKFEDAVLRLEMTPHVIDGQHLKMKIAVTKDEVDLTRAVEGNPFIIKKKTETTLIARHNETIVISGLTKSTGSYAERGMPGLKDLPVLGWLFKSQNKSQDLEEVLIFITPTILKEWQPGETQKSLDQIKKDVKEEIEKDKQSQ